MNKTALIWTTTKLWCIANPEKSAAIVGPDGTVTLTFTPKSTAPLKGQDQTLEPTTEPQ